MILSLVAAGRISAAEAERLIVAWSVDREFLLLAVAGAVLLAAQGVFHAAGIGHLAHVLAPGCHWLRNKLSHCRKRD